MKNKVLVLLALLGIFGSIYIVFKSKRTLPTASPVVLPFLPNYNSFIAANGIIESESDNIEISTHISGVVKDVFVKVNDKIKKDEVLFVLDTRSAEADVNLKKAELLKSNSFLHHAKLSFESAFKKIELARKVAKSNVISEDEFLARELEYIEKLTKLKQAEADVAVCDASLKASEVKLDLLTIRSPIDGEVLQVNIHKGEWAGQSFASRGYKKSLSGDPLMLIGDSKLMHVRIDIDENEAYRFKKDAKAIAVLRGNTNIRFDLKYQRIEPYAVPKKSLSGLSSEKVDTRVLQVIYSFDPKDFPIFIGQQVDVFIEADEPNDL